jgi:hypothetical protein
MPTQLAAAVREPTPPPAWTPRARPGVWALTLWTADRAPLLVGLNDEGVGLSHLGRLVQQIWEDLPRRFAGVIPDEFVVLPDRVRAIVHVGRAPRPESVARVVAWIKARANRLAREAGLGGGRRVWEPGYEGQLLTSAEELGFWRRRIRAGLAGVFGSGPLSSPAAASKRSA